jgi:hypothetical protein
LTPDEVYFAGIAGGLKVHRAKKNGRQLVSYRPQ